MMASKRRSARSTKSIKYFDKEVSSEDENEDPKLKKAKIKLKEMMNEDSDAESDFEAELKKEDVKVEDPSSEDEISEAEERMEQEAMMTNYYKGAKTSLKSANFFKPMGSLKPLIGLKPKLGGRLKAGSRLEPESSLQLSDSGSSSDEDERERRKERNLAGGVRVDSRSSSMEEEKTGEGDDAQSSQTLIALAQNLTSLNSVWTDFGEPSKSESKICSPEQMISTPEKKSSRGRKSRSKGGGKTEKNLLEDSKLDSITKLLARGEGVENYSEEDEDEEKEDAKEHILPTQSIQINIDLPDKARRKKKKGFDVSAFLKRELAKVRRETQILLHQAHFVSLVAHLRYLNLALTDELLYGSALSLIPSAHTGSPQDFNLTKLSSLVRWLRDLIPVNKTKFSSTSRPFRDRQRNVLETFLAMEPLELVTTFVLVCRALGFNTRIVLNFDITPLKPPAENATKPVKPDPIPEPVKEDKKEKPKSKKSKRAASDSEGEEDVEEKPSKKSLSAKISQKSNRSCSRSISAKLAEASKRKSSTQNPSTSKSASSNEREEEMIRKINKKYPTKIEEKDVQEKPSGSKKRKSEESTGPSTGKGSKSTKITNPKFHYWSEVYLETDKKWVCVDLETGRINSPPDIESKLSKPLYYIVSIDNMGNMKDVSKRYGSNYMTTTRKIRHDEKWISAVIGAFDKQDRKDSKEDMELIKTAEEAPMPTTVSGFKSHPLYVLKRHLLKFEAIYPPDAPPIGWMKSEPVYARECVHTLQGRTSWLKEGRTVRLGEDPYNIVKARPKWDRMTGSMVKDEPLEVFGRWQTELYIPPPAIDGKVPRNEYGNVELFKPWMLPKGCVHIPINGMTRVLRKLNIDAAPAMMGWDFSGGCHPIYDGYVICEEFADIVMDAWNQEQEIKAERDAEKREKRILDNWRRIVKGLFIREKIQAKYMRKKE